MPTAASCDSCMRLLAGRLVDIWCEVQDHGSCTWEMAESVVTRKWKCVCVCVNGCKHKSPISTTKFLTSYGFGTNASEWSKIMLKNSNTSLEEMS